MTDTRDRRERPDWATLPNAITLARLLLFVPLVTYAIGSGKHPVVATVLLLLFGSTDWIDGYLARRLNQVSRTGQILDPLADRLGIWAIAVAMLVSGVLPWWALVSVAGTDIVLIVAGAVRRNAIGRLRVVRVGKIRTAILMTSLPLLTLSAADLEIASMLRVVGTVLLAIGSVLHVAAGTIYLTALIRAPRQPAIQPAIQPAAE